MAALNVLHILRTIKEHGTVSRTDLQEITGLSWGTITNTTRELLDRNLIREEGPLQTKAGRKPMRLALNPASHSLVGVDIAPGVVRCVALNLAGDVLWEERQEYAAATPPMQVLDLAAGLVRDALHTPEIAVRLCLGVGVAAQGAIDVARGIMRLAPRMPGWANVPIRDYLQLKISAPVLVEHDPNCLALAERWFGAASAADDVLCINLGEGIGMGILIKGEIFRGAQQMAGEFGHVTLDPNGPACACGDHGCVEAFCALPAIIEAVRKEQHNATPAIREAFQNGGVHLADLLAAAQAGDAVVAGAFRKMGRYLGVGVANLIDMFNPALVVLCGPLTAAREFFLPALQEQVARHAWKHSLGRTVISELGQRAVAIGACGIVLQSVFDNDAVVDSRRLQRA